MKHLKFILAVILMLVIIIIVVQNHEAMSTNIVFRVNLFSLNLQSSMVSLYYIVPTAFLFGVIITGLYGMIERFQLKKQIRILVSTTEEKDKELNSLRNLPITADDVPTTQMMEPVAEAEKEEI